MKKLYCLCQLYYPDSSSTSQLLRPLFQELSSDLEITVLCGYPGRREAEHVLVPRMQVVDGVTVVHCGLPVAYRRNYLLRAIAYGSFLIHASWRLLFVKKADVVIGISNPPFVLHVLWFLSLLRSSKFDYLLHDVYPEGLVAMGVLKPRAVTVRFWRLLNRWGYRRADKVVVLGRDMKELVEREYDLPPENCVFIPHWSPIEVEEPKPIQDSRLLQRLELKEKFVVQYSGNMGLWNDMESLVRAASELRQSDDIHFLFIGNGMRRAAAEQLSAAERLTNITWLDFAPLDQLQDSLSSCDCAIISQDKGLEGIAVPCKLYGILASGRAILAQVPSRSEVALTVTENNCGTVVEPGASAGLADAIRAMHADRAETRKQGARAFSAYHRQYRLKNSVDAFRELWRVSRVPMRRQIGHRSRVTHQDW